MISRWLVDLTRERYLYLTLQLVKQLHLLGSGIYYSNIYVMYCKCRGLEKLCCTVLLLCVCIPLGFGTFSFLVLGEDTTVALYCMTSHKRAKNKNSQPHRLIYPSRKKKETEENNPPPPKSIETKSNTREKKRPVPSRSQRPHPRHLIPMLANNPIQQLPNLRAPVNANSHHALKPLQAHFSLQL